MNTLRTDNDLRMHCKAVGMSFTKRDGEYRIIPGTYTFPQFTTQEREEMAYYTNDRVDAANTASRMSAELKGGK